MSFTNNASNIIGKSTTNAFNVVATNLTVEKNALVKGDLTVLGNTNIGSVTLENGSVNNLTVNNLTVTTPIPTTSGGTGLATIGAPNQILSVNGAGTGLTYVGAGGLSNPSTITGSAFAGSPTFNFGIEQDGPAFPPPPFGRGFIRTSAAATELVLGSTTSDILRLSGSSGSANLFYNSSGTSGVFQVTNAGGAITFTNSGSGTISMATAGGSITLADPTATNAVNIGTAGGVFNLSTGVGTLNIATGAGTMNITTTLGIMNIGTGGGALNIATGVGNLSVTATTGILSLTTAAAGAVNVGAAGVGAVNIFGSLATISSTVLAISAGGVQGTSGAWNFTTGTFTMQSGVMDIYAAGAITLRSGLTGVFGIITLNGNGTTSYGPLIINASGGTPSYPASITVNGGDITATGGNIYSSQNINWGFLNVNSNTTLTVNSPKSILVRGGPGVTITLPNATTLITGWNYTINNNSGQTVTVNDASAGLVVSLLSGQFTNVYLLTNPNAAGTWDFHLAGSNSFIAPVTVTSTSPSTTLLSLPNTSTAANTVSALSITSASTAQATAPIASFFQSGLATTQFDYINFGRSTGLGLAGQLTYTYNTAIASATVGLGFTTATSAPTNFISCTQGGAVTITAASGISMTTRATITNTSVTTSTLTLSNTGATAHSAATLAVGSTSPAQATAPIASFFQSGLATTQYSFLSFGKSAGLGLSGQLTYTSNTTVANCTVALGFSNTAVSAGVNFLSATQGGLVTISGIHSGYTSPALAVNSTTTTSGSIVNFLAPVTSGNQAAIGFGTATTTGNMGTLGFITGATTAANTLQLGFIGNVSPILQLVNDGQTINLNGVASVTGSQAGIAGGVGPSTGILNVINSNNPSGVAMGQSTIATFFTPCSAALSSSINMYIGRNMTECIYITYFASNTAANRACFMGLQTTGSNPYAPYMFWREADVFANNLPNITFGSSITVINQQPTTSSVLARLFLPNASASGNSGSIIFGRSETLNESCFLSYIYNTTVSNSTMQLGFYASSFPFLKMTASGDSNNYGSNSHYFQSSGATICRFGDGTSSGSSSYFGETVANSALGNARVSVQSLAGGFMVFFVGSAAKGGITYDAGLNVTVYGTTSDYRLKTNIEPISNSLEIINKLNPVTYDWLEQGHNRSFGFIAHEVQENIPIVSGKKDEVDEKGEPVYQQIDYSKFTPYTVAAIKELYSIIQTLQARITLLESNQ